MLESCSVNLLVTIFEPIFVKIFSDILVFKDKFASNISNCPLSFTKNRHGQTISSNRACDCWVRNTWSQTIWLLEISFLSLCPSPLACIIDTGLIHTCIMAIFIMDICIMATCIGARRVPRLLVWPFFHKDFFIAFFFFGNFYPLLDLWKLKGVCLFCPP